MTALHNETVARIADASVLDGRLTLCRSDDATLDDVRNLLAVTGRMLREGRLDPIATSGFLVVAVEALGRFDAASRCAPPSALADAVGEFGTACGAEDCSEQVYPWADDPSYCSDECRRRGAE